MSTRGRSSDGRTARVKPGATAVRSQPVPTTPLLEGPHIKPGSQARGYAAGKAQMLYPALGDPPPPGGTRVLLKTRGGVCTQGYWGDPFFVAWSLLPEGDKDKEQRMRELGLMD